MTPDTAAPAVPARKLPALNCPFCGSAHVDRLPGGIVWECLNPTCGFAFSEAEAREAKRHAPQTP